VPGLARSEICNPAYDKPVTIVVRLSRAGFQETKDLLFLRRKPRAFKRGDEAKPGAEGGGDNRSSGSRNVSANADAATYSVEPKA